ncbi:MAG TPA: PH domain-containing protein [Thermoanaerobaculia bacterium]|nr:PH domain-containing protein [Thermoanaerobaculia bacterium]
MAIQDQLQPGEEILYVARVTRWTEALWIALAALALAGAAFAWFGFDNAPGALTALALAAGFTAVLGWNEFVRRSHEYVLTSRRVIQQMGILTRRSIDSWLDKINNIEHRQTIWGRILGFGDVEIETASEQGIIRFANVARPLELKNAIVGATEQYRGTLRSAPYPVAAPGPSGAERMRQLRTLYDDGLISLEEYESKRRQLLQEL